MNRHRNGTVIVGEPGSYWYMQSALTDLLKGKGKNKPKSYEVHWLGLKIGEIGRALGKTPDEMAADYNELRS